MHQVSRWFLFFFTHNANWLKCSFILHTPPGLTPFRPVLLYSLKVPTYFHNHNLSFSPHFLFIFSDQMKVVQSSEALIETFSSFIKWIRGLNVFFCLFFVWSLGCLNVFALSCFFSFVLHLMRRNRAGGRGNVHLREHRSLVWRVLFPSIFSLLTQLEKDWWVDENIESLVDIFFGTELFDRTRWIPRPLVSSVCHCLASEVLWLSAFVVVTTSSSTHVGFHTGPVFSSPSWKTDVQFFLFFF